MSYAKRAAPVLALAAVLIFWEAAVRLFQIPLYVLPYGSFKRPYL